MWTRLGDKNGDIMKIMNEHQFWDIYQVKKGQHICQNRVKEATIRIWQKKVFPIWPATFNWWRHKNKQEVKKGTAVCEHILNCYNCQKLGLIRAAIYQNCNIIGDRKKWKSSYEKKIIGIQKPIEQLLPDEIL